MVTKTEAIKMFLCKYAHPDFSRAYNINMECQINVEQGEGTPIEGEYKGKRWVGFRDEDGGVYKPFRIPYKAYTDPEFEDSELKFNLEKHCSAIGMTGWDWKNRESLWFAYDFDALVGHSEKHLAKLTQDELDNVIEAASDLQYVTVRRSAGGLGIHLYVYVDRVPTANHHEHAALSRAILGKMATDTGFDFNGKLDVCGGNMWVWHSKAKGKKDAFKVIKEGYTLVDVPKNWRDHITVVKGTRKRLLPQEIPSGKSSDFDELISKNVKTPLGEQHLKLLEYLKTTDNIWWWDADNHLLVTHTVSLQEASVKLGYKGIFITDSQGTDKREQNCFCCPEPEGVWRVRRFTAGCAEHPSWQQDSGGWSATFLNKTPNLRVAANTHEGVENVKGAYEFAEARTAVLVLEELGVFTALDHKLEYKPTTIQKHKDGRLVVSVETESNVSYTMPGWSRSKANTLTKIFSAKSTDNATRGELLDGSIRWLVESTSGTLIELGWFMYNEGLDAWISMQATSVRDALKHFGFKSSEIGETMGASVARPWVVVSEPFQEEYLGERTWNRGGAKFRFTPTDKEEDFKVDAWLSVFNHLGVGLDLAVSKDAWCIKNNINTGATYLLAWCASLFQKPKEPLPYLFLFSESQNTGKTTLGEALSILMTRGAINAASCLDPSNTFNGELDGAILCLVEEVELNRSTKVYNRLKDWVTAYKLGIHKKGVTPYDVKNMTHWIQTGNNFANCPVFPGDTRIVVISVEPFTGVEVPREALRAQLVAQASDFLGYILSVELPETTGRLAIPCVATSQKQALIKSATTPVGDFLNAQCEQRLGVAVSAKAFVAAFHTWLDDVTEEVKWTSHKVYKELPIQHMKGYASWAHGYHIPNLVVLEDNGLKVPFNVVEEGTRLVLDEKSKLVLEG